MLGPYVMVGFMLIAITGLTTLLVIGAMTSLGAQLETDEEKKIENYAIKMKEIAIETETLLQKA